MNIWQIALVQPLANGLIIFYKFLGQNMGVAIILFSVFLRFVLNPLTKPYMDSMKKMKDFAPELEKLKVRHKDNKEMFAKAQADFYKQKGFNPGAGCLPYLLQIVILIALFNVFSSVLTANGEIVNKINTLLYEPLKFAQGTIINTKFLYLDVTKPDVFHIAGVPFPIPGPLLILSALIQMLSAKMTAPFVEKEKKIAKKTKGEEDDMQVAMQSSAIYTFPLMTILIGVSFSSGLALYWLVFSLYQMIQQYYSSGWGGLTPWLTKLNLLQSPKKK
ncbi:MAG: YidC/Oxa1 family membrane protein insertase [Patescibacteria group bacterium]